MKQKSNVDIGIVCGDAMSLGPNIANRIAIEELVDNLVIVSLTENFASDNAADIAEAHGVVVSGGDKYDLLKGCSIIVITGAVARKPGMTREDLLKFNKKLYREIAQNIREYAPGSRVIIAFPNKQIRNSIYEVVCETLNRRDVVDIMEISNLDDVPLVQKAIPEFAIAQKVHEYICDMLLDKLP